MASLFLCWLLYFVTLNNAVDLKGARIAVIGGGHYGSLIALSLAEEEEAQVTLYEKNSGLFQGTSGTFGVRMHAGPHYPRSKATRDGCRTVFKDYEEKFPDFIVPSTLSLYALGRLDANNNPSLTSFGEFDEVCQECVCYKQVNPIDYHIENVQGLWKVHEPFFHMSRPRKEFSQRLSSLPNVELAFNHNVQSIEYDELSDTVKVDGKTYDWVINASFFKSFATDMPVAGSSVMYQPVVAFKYKDRWAKPEDNPFSFTVMDGLFPNLIPVVTEDEEGKRSHVYIMNHAKYNILGSFSTFEESERYVADITPEKMEEIRPLVEADMTKYRPDFQKQFQYLDYVIETATRLNSKTAFRSALVWRKDKMINVLSGKVNESLRASQEVIELIKRYETTAPGENAPRSVNDILKKYDVDESKANSVTSHLRVDSSGYKAVPPVDSA